MTGLDIIYSEHVLYVAACERVITNEKLLLCMYIVYIIYYVHVETTKRNAPARFQNNVI